jgi:DNA (cytosine-5)-methyltransferase 1
MSALTAIDLFAGAGGLSEGFRQAGFEVLAANDFDPESAETFRQNHPDTLFIGGPIQEVDTSELLGTVGLRRGELSVLLGGPPCQAFSVYNHQRGMHDERSGLFRQYLRVVEGLMPRFVVMENVTGITSVADGRAVSEIHQSLKKLGYTVESRILKAEEYGVPQERRRIFFLASLDFQEIPWPDPSHGHSAGLLWTALQPHVTVRDAIGDLPPLAMGEGEEESRYGGWPCSDYQRLLRDGSPALYNHVAPSLGKINVERLKHIPQGGSWRDIPEALLPAGMKKARRSDHTKRYGRLHPEGLSCTILTKCDLHWGAYIHPDQERTLTVREAARFQSFPDRIRFYGSRGGQFRQVGNAVPPLLAKAVAMPIAEALGLSQEKVRAVAG